MSDRPHLVRQKIQYHIAAFGQSVVGVDGAVPFFYTVGRAIRNLPELLVAYRMPIEDGTAMLNAFDNAMPDAVTSGTLVGIGGRFPAMIIDTDPQVKVKFTKSATVYHRSDRYQVQQIVLCDKEGLYPPDCSRPFSLQPILGHCPSDRSSVLWLPTYRH